MNNRFLNVLWVLMLAGCAGDLDQGLTPGLEDMGEPIADMRVDAGDSADSGADLPVLEPDMTPDTAPDMTEEPEPCSTRIWYGESWIRPERPTTYDDVQGKVTWDGVCQVDGAGNGFAELSNGWKPYFEGRSCVIGFEYSGACEDVPTSCRTRIGYGPSWMAPANHPNRFDDVQGVVTWEGTCRAAGGDSAARLSNGWDPHFQGGGACDLAFRYEQCGGLFHNPVIRADCPDPGILKDGDRYYLTCTHTGGPGLFPIYTSTDLVNWSRDASILAERPGWANDRFWAPEIHKVDEGLYVAYYTASTRSNNRLSIGAATASSPLGPFTDIGEPLIYDPNPGVIDAHYFRASDGKRYLTWKRDGNAVGARTPIFLQEVAADGVTLSGPVSTILTNDRTWEGAVVEGQWIVEKDGYFYLFYSGNGYASPSYGVGIARATSVRGPYTKASSPILRSNGQWDGPGHGAILPGPSGDWVHVYHAWQKGRVGQSPGRQVLVDRVTWSEGWPQMLGAPSRRSQPMP
ncbi:family 43 glycosylhydrolase [Microvenator marinus]|uniref:Family 43 glycosylhydrolase n=1 Tax=Microvenator marinus TaxID=2600177 RepID=A0A5B8XL34_9DELT|nr:glycoside hydrolase family 43 protein [Microvenator marinus]QED25811.1 family 43 glycosylhydrolase [Microvenator marinus]